mmetsp:Transcript_35886/g.93306  ORF Transcript_35886/g.93306 Transcript_35886/m.93306 type:complete len:361 (-) Transcript_35886:4-1086(-)
MRSSACCSVRATLSARCASISSKQDVNKATTLSPCTSPLSIPRTRTSSTLAGRITARHGVSTAWTIIATACVSPRDTSPAQKRKLLSSMEHTNSLPKTPVQKLRECCATGLCRYTTTNFKSCRAALNAWLKLPSAKTGNTSPGPYAAAMVARSDSPEAGPPMPSPAPARPAPKTRARTRFMTESLRRRKPRESQSKKPGWPSPPSSGPRLLLRGRPAPRGQQQHTVAPWLPSPTPKLRKPPAPAGGAAAVGIGPSKSGAPRPPKPPWPEALVGPDCGGFRITASSSNELKKSWTACSAFQPQDLSNCTASAGFWPAPVTSWNSRRLSCCGAVRPSTAAALCDMARGPWRRLSPPHPQVRA